MFTIKVASIDKKRESLYERDIKILFQDYLNTGGFIEVLAFEKMAL